MAFSYYRSITIDHTKCGSGDSSGFPVLISGTYSYLATVGNGGKVQNANGYDVGFYSDSALTTKLPWEVELYTASTGLVIYWVQVPTLSVSVDTVIYMAYGDPSISTDQSNKTGTWDSGFAAVYHMNDNAANSNVLDSTSNANTGTATNGSPINTNTSGFGGQTGKIGSCIAFDGSSQYITIPNSTSLNSWLALTVSAWIKASTGMAQYARLMEKGSNNEWTLAWNVTAGSNKLSLQLIGQSGVSVTSSSALADGSTWHKVDAVITHPSNYAESLGVDNSFTSGITSNSTPTKTHDLRIANYGGGGLLYKGSIDEIRISTVNRNTDWLTSEYNGQSAPDKGTFGSSGFYTVGSEIATTSFHPQVRVF